MTTSSWHIKFPKLCHVIAIWIILVGMMHIWVIEPYYSDSPLCICITKLPTACCEWHWFWICFSNYMISQPTGPYYKQNHTYTMQQIIFIRYEHRLTRTQLVACHLFRHKFLHKSLIFEASGRGMGSLLTQM